MENEQQKAVTRDFLTRLKDIFEDMGNPILNKYSFSDMESAYQEVIDIKLGPNTADSIHIILYTSKKAAI